MKILYVAKHGPQDNADEDAISHALRSLGHDVRCIHERNIKSVLSHYDSSFSFTLFHKPEHLEFVNRIPGLKCYWYFDLIDHPDPQLYHRCIARRAWAERALQVFDIGFMTDGDWVARHPDKLVHLLQGADERVIGKGTASESYGMDIVFTGTPMHGNGRVEFCEEMKARYGDQFALIGHKAKDRIHGRKLADLMASVKIVLAPDCPSTDRYWSNRVYQALGFGAFLLHPRCKGLESSFNDGEEIIYYDNRAHLHSLIKHYLQPESTEYREYISRNGLQRIKKEHLYRHRCIDLINTMKTRFKL